MSKLPKTLRITDDSGFLAIVNPPAYSSFVNENWELAELINHFIAEMNNHHLIIWGTGCTNEWNVCLTSSRSGEKPFREFTQAIKVTNGRLYLTNYEDLTMAAQFSDMPVPASHSSDLFIELENGYYDLTICQMFDPDDFNYEAGQYVNFNIIIQKSEKPTAPVERISWWEL